VIDQKESGVIMSSRDLFCIGDRIRDKEIVEILEVRPYNRIHRTRYRLRCHGCGQLIDRVHRSLIDYFRGRNDLSCRYCAVLKHKFEKGVYGYFQVTDHIVSLIRNPERVTIKYEGVTLCCSRKLVVSSAAMSDIARLNSSTCYRCQGKPYRTGVFSAQYTVAELLNLWKPPPYSLGKFVD
jgi:hypothetical protein